MVLSGLQRARPGTEAKVTEATITAGPEFLPDEYQPVTEDQWLTPKRQPAANVVTPVVEAGGQP